LEAEQEVASKQKRKEQVRGEKERESSVEYGEEERRAGGTESSRDSQQKRRKKRKGQK